MDALPSYGDLKSRYCMSSLQSDFIKQSRQTIINILNGIDPRLLLIIGPCSIHDLKSAREFAEQLKELAAAISSQFFTVMRVYCEKPRTTAGWKGILYDPFLDGSNQIKAGIELTRQLLLDLADLGVPAATEFLDPLTAYYYNDLISWGSIGARTSSSQTHRQLASGLAMPMGIKNGIAGNVSAAIDGVIAASLPHAYIGINSAGVKSIIRTNGNPNAHIVLRGGESGPNYDPLSVSDALSKLEQASLSPRLVIDCSHHNSNKQHYHQTVVFQSLLQQIIEGNTNIRGCLLESHLFAGSQPLTGDPKQLEYGISITDPCLDWKTTRHLLLWGAEHFAQHHFNRLCTFHA
ncbi:MAG: 3-deoxy-7-phosphoheptulonate synthase [Chlamydiales bacterium]